LVELATSNVRQAKMAIEGISGTQGNCTMSHIDVQSLSHQHQ